MYSSLQNVPHSTPDKRWMPRLTVDFHKPFNQVIKKCCKSSTELVLFQAKNYFLHIFLKITVTMFVLWICKIQTVHETEETLDCFRKCDDTAHNKLTFNCVTHLWRFIRLAYHNDVELRIISDILFQHRFLHSKDGDTDESAQQCCLQGLNSRQTNLKFLFYKVV